MFSTLKFSNFSVNIVCVAGVFFFPFGLFFLLWKSKRFSRFLFRSRFSFRAAVTLTLRTTKKTHQKPPAMQASVNRAKF